MHEEHTTENDALIIEARHRLAEHETIAGEMLDDLASENVETHHEGVDAFSNYAERYTWWHRNIFRIYLSSGDTAEHLDLHVDNTLDPRRLVYHLETLAGGVDIRVNFGSALFLYAAMALDEFGDFTF